MSNWALDEPPHSWWEIKSISNLLLQQYMTLRHTCCIWISSFTMAILYNMPTNCPRHRNPHTSHKSHSIPTFSGWMALLSKETTCTQQAIQTGSLFLWCPLIQLTIIRMSTMKAYLPGLRFLVIAAQKQSHGIGSLLQPHKQKIYSPLGSIRTRDMALRMSWMHIENQVFPRV